jgi:hypothetical protein
VGFVLHFVHGKLRLQRSAVDIIVLHLFAPASIGERHAFNDEMASSGLISEPQATNVLCSASLAQRLKACDVFEQREYGIGECLSIETTSKVLNDNLYQHVQLMIAESVLRAGVTGCHEAHHPQY